MSVRYTVSEDGMLVRATASGFLTEQDIYGYLQDVLADGRIQTGYNALFDVSRIEDTDVVLGTFQEISTRTERNPKKTPRSKVAIVVSQDRLYENARVFEQLSSPRLHNVIVFNDISTAETWLGIVGGGSRDHPSKSNHSNGSTEKPGP
jgi:hypothetical protein